jgi:cellulose biosynthesis protein BcsQ
MAAPIAKGKGCRFVTFYSYKGGTGRSMLVANVAWILASNRHRVLTIDWDLEAPGLHRYFEPFLRDKSLSSTEGIIDAVSDFVEAAVLVEPKLPAEADSGSASEDPKAGSVSDQTPSDDKNWYVEYANLLRYVVPLNWKFPEPGRLDFIGAGRQGPSYVTKVNLFDWEQFYSKFAGETFLDAAKSSIAEQYEYVLIDSRTGVSDTSGICTRQLPDTLVVCFTLNNQSIEGARAVTAAAQEYRERSAKLKPLVTIPVPTRVDGNLSDLANLGRELARVRFRPYVPLPAELRDNPDSTDVQQYWGDIEVPYSATYAYEEVLACFADLPHLKNSILSSAEKLATLIRGRATELMPPSDHERAAVLQQFARKPYVVVLAEEFVAGLPSKDQSAVRRLFTRLVQVNPAERAVAPDVAARTLIAHLPDGASALLSKAVDAKLVVRDSVNNEPTVQMADNRMVTAWPRLRNWVENDRPFLVWLQRFVGECRTWEVSHENPEDLLTGTSLEEAAKWLRARPEDLAQREIKFILDSQQADESVRREAAEEFTTVAVARRRTSDYIRDERKRHEEEKQRLEGRLEEEKSLALAAVQKSYRQRILTIFGTVILILGIGVGLFFWLQNKNKEHVQQQTSATSGELTKGSGVSSATGAVDTELRQQLASTLVSLEIVSTPEAGMQMKPVEGVRAIDKLIASSKPGDPKRLLAEGSRINFLKSSQALFASSPELKNYVCEHNFYVRAAQASIADASSELALWRRQYPLAQPVPQKADDSNSVPIVVKFFLTCDEAGRQAGKIAGNVKPWFNDCPECTLSQAKMAQNVTQPLSLVVLYLSESKERTARQIADVLKKNRKYADVTVTPYDSKMVHWKWKQPAELHYFKPADKQNAEDLVQYLGANGIRVPVRFMNAEGPEPGYLEIWLLDTRSNPQAY